MSQNNPYFGSRQTPFSKSSAPKRPNHFAVYAIFALLVASNVALGLALTMGSEISQLWARTKDPVLTAYETRILQLRMEVDRLHSQKFLQAGNLNLQLQELLQQQEFLTEQYELIQTLAQKAQTLGITTAEISSSPILADPLTTGNIFSRTPTFSSQSGQIESVQKSLIAMNDNTGLLLNTLSDSAQNSTQIIVDELNKVGINPVFDQSHTPGVGGPFIPAQTSSLSSSTIYKTNQVMNALENFAQARTILNAAPIHFPLANENRISSPFGNRSDPFGGARSFHSGIDYPAPTGTGVFSAGQGKVTYAGRKGGYGNFIEIEHANGLITRYGHLSSILVSTGQQVNSGFRIGNVGSTGRSTGPHLHFEIRRGQTATNPQNFIDVSRALKDFIG